MTLKEVRIGGRIENSFNACLNSRPLYPKMRHVELGIDVSAAAEPPNVNETHPDLPYPKH